MRVSRLILLASLKVALALLFLTFNVNGLGPGALGDGVIGSAGLVRLNFKVEVIDESGDRRPINEAKIVVGLVSGSTNELGEATLEVVPGTYSSYVKPPSPRLAPLLINLDSSRDVNIRVVFQLQRLKPRLLEVDLFENSTTILLEVETPEGFRAYIADPVIGYIRNDGERRSINPSDVSLSPFNLRVKPGSVHLVRVVIEDEVALLNLAESYVPAEVIHLGFSYPEG